MKFTDLYSERLKTYRLVDGVVNSLSNEDPEPPNNLGIVVVVDFLLFFLLFFLFLFRFLRLFFLFFFFFRLGLSLIFFLGLFGLFRFRLGLRVVTATLVEASGLEKKEEIIQYFLI